MNRESILVTRVFRFTVLFSRFTFNNSFIIVIRICNSRPNSIRFTIHYSRLTLYDIRLYLMQFSMYNSEMNSDSKIVEDYLLIQGSFNNWMISNCYWIHCLRPGNVRFLYCLSSWGNQRFPRRCRSASACSHLPSQTRLRLAPADAFFPRKEVIQPHLPVRLPCYDFTPVTNPALGRCFHKG